MIVVGRITVDRPDADCVCSWLLAITYNLPGAASSWRNQGLVGGGGGGREGGREGEGKWFWIPIAALQITDNEEDDLQTMGCQAQWHGAADYGGG